VRRTRLSTGSAEDDEKRLRGFQHIISELSAENAEVKEKYESVLEEVALLKEVSILFVPQVTWTDSGRRSNC
jgi:hypothetical protein